MHNAQINKALSDFLEKYNEDHTIVYGNYNEKIYGFHKTLSRQMSIWKKSRKCIFNKCKDNSIKHSHTIQKSSSLKFISENGELLCPEETISGFILKPVGINQASTFPGFCINHEKLFNEFEINRHISKDIHVVLQIYRSTCREIVRLKHEIIFYETEIGNHIVRRNKYIIEYVKNEVGHIINESYFSINNDTVIVKFTQIIERLKRQLDVLENFHLIELTNAINNSNTDITAIRLSIDCVIPVCLSGLCNFKYEKNGQLEKVVSVVSVIPYSDHTLIIISGRNQDESAINSYLSHYNDSMSLLNMIEAWMIFETDHWFLKPSVWDDIKPEIKEHILYDLRNADSSLLEYNYSIFNKIRITMINSAREQLGTPGKEAYFQSIIDNESKKI